MTDFTNVKPEFVDVKEFQDVTGEIFDQILQSGQPALIKSCDYGPCMDRWNIEYLEKSLGNTVITIHESQQADLSFINKNFRYKSCKFSEFCKLLLQENSFVYLRSINKNPQHKVPADIGNDFPSLRDDLKPPKFIPSSKLTSKLYHSSVLRIASAGIQVWTHFDLCDNILVQVIGTKRIILIPPEDTRYLYVDGDKSRVNCFDDLTSCLEKYPLIKNAKLFYCSLMPGDSLYIPSLWWHNIRTIDEKTESSSLNYSIGFNIFWKDPMIEERSLYAEGDVYGNKNLIPYESALSNLEKLVHHLNKLPGKYNMFYRQMIVQRLKQRLLLDDN